MEHSFGGPWTEDKLRRIDKYLRAYMTIFERNKKAALLETYYVDAFAGTGQITSPTALNRPEGSLFEDALEDADARQLKEGSAYVALRQERPFDHYVFVDRSERHAGRLQRLREEFPELSQKIEIRVADANEFLAEWCRATDWRGKRAVIFLDPYGMQVEWSTLEALAATKAVDLWVLFPLGQAVNRLLTRGRLPMEAHAERLLTRLFGTEEWTEAFYSVEDRQTSIFDELGEGEGSSVAKRANFEAIGNFFVERLKTIFQKVAANPLQLMNSRRVPLYLLCFAASNPVGATTAVKIAHGLHYS